MDGMKVRDGAFALLVAQGVHPINAPEDEWREACRLVRVVLLATQDSGDES